MRIYVGTYVLFLRRACRQINAITRSANELTTGGYELTMNLNGGQPITVSSCVPVVFSVKRPSGDPDTTLQPLLGAAVHVLIFRFVDSKNFTSQHIHGWTGSQDIHGTGCQGGHMMEMKGQWQMFTCTAYTVIGLLRVFSVLRPFDLTCSMYVTCDALLFRFIQIRSVGDGQRSV